MEASTWTIHEPADDEMLGEVSRDKEVGPISSGEVGVALLSTVDRKKVGIIRDRAQLCV